MDESKKPRLSPRNEPVNTTVENADLKPTASTSKSRIPILMALRSALTPTTASNTVPTASTSRSSNVPILSWRPLDLIPVPSSGPTCPKRRKEAPWLHTHSPDCPHNEPFKHLALKRTRSLRSSTPSNSSISPPPSPKRKRRHVTLIPEADEDASNASTCSQSKRSRHESDSTSSSCSSLSPTELSDINGDEYVAIPRRRRADSPIPGSCSQRTTTTCAAIWEYRKPTRARAGTSMDKIIEMLEATESTTDYSQSEATIGEEIPELPREESFTFSTTPTESTESEPYSSDVSVLTHSTDTDLCMYIERLTLASSEDDIIPHLRKSSIAFMSCSLSLKCAAKPEPTPLQITTGITATTPHRCDTLFVRRLSSCTDSELSVKGGKDLCKKPTLMSISEDVTRLTSSSTPVPYESKMQIGYSDASISRNTQDMNIKSYWERASSEALSIRSGLSGRSDGMDIDTSVGSAVIQSSSKMQRGSASDSSLYKPPTPWYENELFWNTSVPDVSMATVKSSRSSLSQRLKNLQQQPSTIQTVDSTSDMSVDTYELFEPTIKMSTIDIFTAEEFASGTALKFMPVTGIDLMAMEECTTLINTKLHSITCMKEYEFKSFEELRYEDYLDGRRGPQSTTSFGTPEQSLGLPALPPEFLPTITQQQPSMFLTVAQQQPTVEEISRLRRST